MRFKKGDIPWNKGMRGVQTCWKKGTSIIYNPKPHKKVLGWIKEYTNLNTVSNYCIKVGKVYGSIDEADPERKVAIYVDGNYWHNYPQGRQWDKTCDTFLKNRGWVVLRFWGSDIKNSPLNIINNLKQFN